MKNVEIENFSRLFLTELVGYIKKQYPAFTCNIKFDYSTRRSCHRGGYYLKTVGFGISLAMKLLPQNLIKTNMPYRWLEYASYENHPVIGNIYSNDPRDRIRGVIAHEVAHAWQYFMAKSNLAINDGPHQSLFRTLYADLRNNLVNIHLPNQAATKAIYQMVVNSAKASEIRPVSKNIPVFAYASNS